MEVHDHCVTKSYCNFVTEYSFLIRITSSTWLSFLLHTLWMNIYCWVYSSLYRCLPTPPFNVWHGQPIPPLKEEVTHTASPTVPCRFVSSQNNLGRRQFKCKISCAWSYLEISSMLPPYPKLSRKNRRNLSLKYFSASGSSLLSKEVICSNCYEIFLHGKTIIVFAMTGRAIKKTIRKRIIFMDLIF